MPVLPISSDSDPLSFSYHEKMSWKLTEENWEEVLILKRSVPCSCILEGCAGGGKGGYVYINNEAMFANDIVFATRWPLKLDLDKIHVNADYKVKTTNGELIVVIEGGRTNIARSKSEYCNIIRLSRCFTINTDLLFDVGKSFILEADLEVEMKDAVNSDPQKTDIYVEEMKSIFDDEETSDVLVIAEGEQFKCHKNVLSARSEVFKNTLGHDTIESKRNKIVIKEITAKAVKDMLKYLYSGEIPDPKNLTTELLQIADMHQLHPLMEACLKNLVRCLDVPSCISTFILVDRYQTQNGNFREIVIEFIKCKAVEVVKEKDCDKLIDSHPALAKELMRALACARKEKHRCKYCVVSYN